ncbi:MAG TPA: AI-2E family transporter [Thermoanaerobaculia bacterium]|jgi:predicted PurR-regulated permease PerM
MTGEAQASPFTPYERTSFVLAALALLAALLLHLVPALLAGFLAWALLQSMARRLRGRVSHGLARALAAAALGLLAAGLVTLAIVVLWGFVRGRVGDLPAVLEKMGETLARLKETLEAAGVSTPLPAHGGSTEALAHWLRENAGALRHAGTVGARGLVHALLGSVLGVLVFFRAPREAPGPLAEALTERLRRFGESFRSVAKAQIEISAVNTILTAVYLFAILPLFGIRLPLAGTLVAITFVCGLIPVAGNLVSNTVIVLVALGVSPWAAAGSLGYLLLVHKLEYFLNAKIVGGRIGAAAWETLLAILVFEAAFGIPGVVLAPVVYAWAKSELVARGLV